jgi:hypothetical protein
MIYSIDVNADGFLTSGKDGFVQQWGRDFSLLGEPIPIPCLLNDTDGNSTKRSIDTQIELVAL